MGGEPRRWPVSTRIRVAGLALGFIVMGWTVFRGGHDRSAVRRVPVREGASHAGRSVPREAGTARASNPSAPPSDGTLTLYDCGPILAGENVRHVFDFKNPFPHVLTLEAENDLRKSCGCTQASLDHRRLEPGQTTTLRVEVDTRSKRGVIHEVVGVTWTDEQGKRHEYGFAVRATVNVALVWQPSELSFSKSEVAMGQSKRAECSSDLSVDWSRATLTPSDPDLEIVRQEVTDENRLLVEVRCRPSDAEQAFRAVQLGLSVPRLDDGRGAAEGRSEVQTPVQLVGELAVSAYQSQSLAVRPRFPLFQLAEEGDVWKGRLIITGDALDGNVDIQSVRSTWGDVEFRTRSLGPHALQADLTLKSDRSEERSADANCPLEIRMADGQTMVITVQLAKPAALQSTAYEFDKVSKLSMW